MESNSNLLQVQDLTKKYSSLTAVNNISFNIRKGEIFGLLGPNGSGKSTTLNIILSLVKPTKGKVILFGSENLDDNRRKIGSILEKDGFYPDMSAEKNLKIVCNIKDAKDEEVEEVLKTVGLVDRKKDLFKSFSFGMKQRLKIAGALLGNPELIIFDEPTNGLDPRGIVEIRELIIDLANNGKTILIASHLLNEMEKICTNILILQKGNVVKGGTLKEVIGAYQNLEEAFIKYTE